jgi:hypothetical protein
VGAARAMAAEISSFFMVTPPPDSLQAVTEFALG